MSDHNKEFDGIRQADNKMPGWYVWSFIGTLIIGVAYLIYYHIATDWSQAKQYNGEVTAHAAKYGAATAGSDVKDANPFRGDAKAIAAGKETFAATCAACHMPDGTGNIGPNLTDATWLHGDSEAALFEVIMDGREKPEMWKQKPAKGPMPSHKVSLGARKVWQVLAFLEDKNHNIRPGK